MTVPLSTMQTVACAWLLFAAVALWWHTYSVWAGSLVVAAFAGYTAGVLQLPAVAALGLFGASAWAFRDGRRGWQRAAGAAGIVVLGLLLATHALPGFDNPVVIRDAVLSPGARPYSQFVNFDKGIAGILLVGIGFMLRPTQAGSRRAALADTVLILLATVAATLALSVALGYVRYEPRWTPVFWTWAPVNLLLTCVGEEAFFRGFVQRELARGLEGRPGAGPIAIAASGGLFGLAHAAGGWPYVLLATVAGTGYALVLQRTGRLEMAILTHFAVNATHFLLFTYPALA
jgi:uncharacterized protein